MQLSFQPVAVVLTLVQTKHINEIYKNTVQTVQNTINTNAQGKYGTH
jgi:hypothetical protein